MIAGNAGSEVLRGFDATRGRLRWKSRNRKGSARASRIGCNQVFAVIGLRRGVRGQNVRRRICQHDDGCIDRHSNLDTLVSIDGDGQRAVAALRRMDSDLIAPTRYPYLKSAVLIGVNHHRAYGHDRIDLGFAVHCEDQPSKSELFSSGRRLPLSEGKGRRS